MLGSVAVVNATALEHNATLSHRPSPHCNSLKSEPLRSDPHPLGASIDLDSLRGGSGEANPGLSDLRLRDEDLGRGQGMMHTQLTQHLSS